MEAIALTLPNLGSGGNNTSFLGGIGGTLSTNNIDLSTGNVKYEDTLIKELAFDLGVDPHALKMKLHSVLQ